MLGAAERCVVLLSSNAEAMDWFASCQGSGGWRNVAAVCVGRCAGIVGFFLVWELCLVN